MKIQKIVGWVATGLLVLFLVGSAMGKMTAMPDSDMGKQFIKIGIFDNRFMFAILEILIAIALIVPRTSALGVLGAIGYWAGAMAVEMSFKLPPFAPMTALVLTTAIAYFRTPELFARALGQIQDK
jgi:DoxX-like family